MEIPDPKFWRLLHSHYVDTAMHQHPENMVPLLALGGTFQHFLKSLVTTRIVARPLPADNEEQTPCIALEIKDDNGYELLVRIPATQLDVDPALVEDMWRTEWDHALLQLTQSETA